MADEWDDDDFGIFESADATASPAAVSQVSSATPSPATPTWLLDMQQAATGVGVAHVPENIKNHSLSTEESSTTDIQPSSSSDEIETQNVSCKRPEDKAVDLFSGGDWEAFTSVSQDENKGIPEVSIHLDENRTANTVSSNAVLDDLLLSTTGEEKETTEASLEIVEPTNPTKDTTAILELQSKLDTALAMKLQTEKSLKELQEELSTVIITAKQERQKQEEIHQKELATVNEEHEQAFKQLKEDSQQTIKLLSEKYASLLADSTAKQSSDYGKSLEEVAEKCLSILEQQKTVLSEKLSEEITEQTNRLSESVDQCKNELRDFVTNENLMTKERCKTIEEDVAKVVEDEVTKHFNIQRDIDGRCKTEAMDELVKSCKKQMEETMKIERDKNCDALKLAVEEARQSVVNSMNRDEKKYNLAQTRHLAALQMLLSTSQDHLRQLEEGLSPTKEME